MTISFGQILRGVAFSMALLVIVGAAHTAARADEVTVSGSTTGLVTGVPPLTFTGNAGFAGTTALNVGSLSGANSLGSFFLNTSQLQPLAGSFTLNITFSNPTGIVGGQGATYTAVVVGTVSPNLDQGGVNITFDNPTRQFSFTNGTSTGSFSLTMANLFVQTGRSAQLTAGIVGEQSAPVPEPATLLLLGSGISGIALKLRRRKRAKAELAN